MEICQNKQTENLLVEDTGLGFGGAFWLLFGIFWWVGFFGWLFFVMVVFGGGVE